MLRYWWFVEVVGFVVFAAADVGLVVVVVLLASGRL